MPAELIRETWRRWRGGAPHRSTSSGAQGALVRFCTQAALRRFRVATRGGLRSPGEAVFTVELGETSRRTWRLPNAVFVNFFSPSSSLLDGFAEDAAPFANNPALLELWQQDGEFREETKALIRGALADKGLHVSMFVESPAHPGALGAVLRDNRIGRMQRMFAGVPSRSLAASA